MILPKTITRFQNSIYAQSIRHGLTLAIPFLIMGSFALLFSNFPVDSYQHFLEIFLNGGLAAIFDTMYVISLGSLALILSVTIGLSFGLLAETDKFLLYPMVAVCSFLAFCGGIESHEEYVFDAEWVFTAMCITILSCMMLKRLLILCSRLDILHTTGAEYLFNLSIQSLVPVTFIILFFTVAGITLRALWGGDNITNFGSYIFLHLFQGLSDNIFGILLYVVISHGLWFVGIHGTNTLDAVSNRLFEHNVEINNALVIAGKAPTEIFSKTFLDIFVFMGGCGCALSFVLALFLASKKSHNRKMSLVAMPSAMFNISEIAVFGFPIIFNFTMLVPFLLTPILLTLTSFFAINTGLVPMVTNSVEWPVPILLSGYRATGSIAGSILQIFNLALGILIYIPFIKRSEKQEAEKFKQAVRQMERDMSEGEKTGLLPQYLAHKYPYNYYAKTLSMDLHNAIKCGQIQLYYQPQISCQGKLHGLEALLRWNHPAAGFIAPPVILGLAYESGFLDDLSLYLLKRACADALSMQEYITDDIFLSINISPKQLQGSSAFDKILQIIRTNDLKNIHPVLEITERAAMEISGYLKEEMERLQGYGVGFSLDDFGMGHNSIIQLQNGSFDEVKLDGQLVTQLQSNKRSEEIISGIIRMSSSLNCRIVAEFVETEELRNLLLELGCTIYQGYYFSRPLELSGLKDYVSRLTVLKQMQT